MSPLHAVTRDSPEVRQLVKSGLTYLDKNSDTRLGGKCVVAYAILKGTMTLDPNKQANVNHRRVKEAVKACRDALNGTEKIDVYSNGLAIIFLCSLDSNKYRREIDGFFRMLYARQKPNGGWGYDHSGYGDTSQTQYGLLSCWEAHHVGIPVNGNAVVRSLNWILRTQDPGGAWGYQGIDPESWKRQRQTEITVSMLAAGLGCALMSSHMLGLDNLQLNAESGEPVELPPAVSVVGAEKEAPPVAGGNQIDRKRLISAVRQANAWMDRNYKVNTGHYNCYYLYSVERYRSFQEVLLSEVEEEPKWYNDGYEYLRSSQQTDNSWTENCGKSVDTAFAILFLVRSMQIDLGSGIGGGTQITGRGLPKNVAQAKMRRGQLVIDDTKKKIDELLKVLEDPTHPDYDQLMSDPRSLTVEASEVRAEDVARLRQMIRGGEPDVRMIASRSLSRRRNLDDVPIFLFAMTDPDRRVVLAARDGLRFISRRLDGFGLQDYYDTEALYDRARFDALNKWKIWYLSIRPGAKIDS